MSLDESTPPSSITGYTVGVSGTGMVAKLQLGPTSGGTSCGTANWNPDANVAGLISAMPDGENIIVGEVYYEYTPLYAKLLSGIISPTPKLIKREAFLHPRSGQLLDLPYSWQAGTGTTSVVISPVVNPASAANAPTSSVGTNLKAEIEGC